MNAVEHDAGADGRVRAGGIEGELSAHAEAYRADGGGGRFVEREQMGDGAGHVFFGFGNLYSHHQLACVVGTFGHVAVIEIGSEGNVSCGGKTVTDVLDMIHESPPFLEHDDAGAAARFGYC